MHRAKLSLLLIGLLVLGSWGALAAADDVELALVDFQELTNEIIEEGGPILGISEREVHEIAEDKGYDLIIDTTSIDFYIEGITESIFDMGGENVTEEIEEVVELDEIEDTEEIIEKEPVVDITGELIEFYEDKKEEME